LKHWSNTLKENEIQSAVLADGRSLDLRAIERLCMARWRFILTISFLCALTAGAVSFLIPNRYTATASILPTVNGGGSSGLLSLAENIPGLDLSTIASAEKSPSLLYPEILSSRLVAQEVLGRSYTYKNGDKWETQNLYRYFGIDNTDKAIRALGKLVNFSTDRKTGVLTINVTTTNPQLSAQIANYYLECLDNFNQNQRKTSAGQNRRFIEKRLLEAKAQLSEAEENLKDLRRRNMNYYNTTDPELAMLNNQLQREVEVKSQVYLTLCQQYELASIQEKKEIPVIQILDSAQPPTIKSGPSRTKTMIIGLLLGAVGALAFLIIEERHPKLKQHLRMDFRIRRLNIVRKGSEDSIIKREHVKQY
jgi:uncharacterized protein involved in exopolysaccharide biosynthesis